MRGALLFKARVAPRFGYGAETHTARLEGHVAVFRAPSLTLAPTATAPLESDGLELWSHFKHREGPQPGSCGCRLFRPPRSGGVRVLMEDSAESVTSVDVEAVVSVVIPDQFGDCPQGRR